MYQSGRLVADEPLHAVSALPSTVLGRAADHGPPAGADRTLSRGDSLSTGSAAVDGVHRVISGAIALSRTLPDGRRQIVDLLGPGRLVGPMAGDRLSVDATALARTRLRRIAAPSAADLSAELSVSLARLHGHALLLGRKSALEKVASGLVELTALFGSRWPEQAQDGPSFVLPMTRSDLGDWLGLVIETVSRALGDLQRRGLIAIERTDIIHIVDPDGLLAATGDRFVRRGIAA